MRRKRDPVLSFRCSSDKYIKLDQLGDLWGENRSRVIARCIDIAYEQIEGKFSKPASLDMDYLCKQLEKVFILERRDVST